jgi:hypothetical protein
MWLCHLAFRWQAHCASEKQSLWRLTLNLLLSLLEQLSKRLAIQDREADGLIRGTPA